MRNELIYAMIKEDHLSGNCSPSERSFSPSQMFLRESHDLCIIFTLDAISDTENITADLL
jgi:hypothetical protein